MARKKHAKQEVDVCLILEGTYPYVRGGVSTWVHQIITSLPNLTFSVFYIGWEEDPDASYQYSPLPSNLVEIKETFLFGESRRRPPFVNLPSGKLKANARTTRSSFTRETDRRKYRRVITTTSGLRL